MTPTTFADRMIKAEESVCTQHGIVPVEGDTKWRLDNDGAVRRLFRRGDGVLGHKAIEIIPSRGFGTEGVVMWFEFDDGSCIDIIEEFNYSASA